MEVLVDHLPGLGLHPGSDERGQVAFRNALDGKLLLHQPHGGRRRHRVLGNRVVGSRLGEEGARRRGLNGVGCVAHATIESRSAPQRITRWG
jgi:hypothetical protein